MKPRSAQSLLFVLFQVMTLCYYSGVNAQRNYHDYSKDLTGVLLDDQFNSLQNKWNLHNSKIENGVLSVRDPGGSIKNPKTSIKVPIDETKDFEIEYTARHMGGLVTASLFWNGYRWQISKKSSTIERTKTFGSALLAMVSNGFRGEEFQKFTIRKIANYLYFYLDEGYLNNTLYKQAEFDGILDIGSIGKIDFDYITVSYLTKNENGIPEKKISTQPTRTQNNTDGLTPITTEIKKGGKYYALIVGVSKYDEPKLNLDKPEKDAEKIKEIFVKQYSFADSTTFLLKNPTRQKIISELYRLRKIIGSNDNLLIFYAGHGFWDEDARQGYWWAKDAVPDDPSTWLSNSDLREQIRSIKSAHTLLISDACFSGGIFKTRSGNDIQNASRDIQMLYQMPSRRAITSGTMTAVPDNSVFLEYLSKRLTDNKNKFLSSQQLFDSFRAAVINNSSAVPQDGVIAETGDEGGDFIFILKEK